MRLFGAARQVGIGLVVLAAGALLPLPLSAQAIGGFERARGHIMLRVVRERLEKHYYDSTYHGINLRATAAQADSQIQVANSNGEIFAIIAQFVYGLGDSHTWFYPPRRTADIKYGWDIEMIGDSCYVVWVEPGSDAAARNLRVGDRVITLNGFPPSRRDFLALWHSLHVITPQPVVRLEIESPGGARRTVDIKSKVTERPRTMAISAYIRELQLAHRSPIAEDTLLRKEVLISRLEWFADPSDIDHVMDRTRKVGTVILDLRGNPGGYEDGLVRLVGRVFDRPLTIAQVHRRRETRPIKSKPVSHPFTGRLVVLIDGGSASSSEVFARLVQLEGRGMVVGDRSAGAVMRSSIYEVVGATDAKNPYAVSITDADVIMPDGQRLEGRGVQPDSLVLPTAADLAAGRDPALAAALTIAGYPTDAARAGELLPPKTRED